MIEAQFNVFDAIVLGILLLSCLVAFFRGFVREVLSLGAWVGAAIVTIYFFDSAAERMRHFFGEGKETLAVGTAALGTYITALIGFSIINAIIVRYVKQGSDVGLLDNSLGLIFGAIRGVFIVSLGFLIITATMDEDNYPDWIEKAQTKEFAEAGADLLGEMAPQYLEDFAVLKKKLKDEQKGDDEPAVADEDKSSDEDLNDAAPAAGYNSKARNALDRLIESAMPEKE